MVVGFLDVLSAFGVFFIMFYCLEGLRLFFVGVQNTPGFFDELIADIFPFWTDLIEE